MAKGERNEHSASQVLSMAFDEENAAITVTGGGASSIDGSTFTASTSTGGPIQGVYQATPTSVADGKHGTARISANRALKTDSDTLSAGENLTTNRLEVSPRYSYSAVATADVQVKSSAGLLHSVTISCNDAAPTAGSLIIYDNTAESDTQVFNHTFTTTPFVPFTVILDYTMATGIYLGFTTTADVNVSCAYL